MLDDIKVNESERINSIIAILEEQKAGVEEKYRKLAEAETESLTAAIESYKQIQKFWEGSEITIPEKPKRKRRTKAEMEAARLAEAELPDDEKVIDEQESEQSEPEFDGAGFTSEDNEVTQQELDSANEFNAEQEATVDDQTVETATDEAFPIEAVEEKANLPEPEPEEEGDPNEWPEFPQDWK